MNGDGVEEQDGRRDIFGSGHPLKRVVGGPEGTIMRTRLQWQAFNSRHAQREACEAYVASQVGVGGIVLPTLYDDGAYPAGLWSGRRFYNF